MKTIWLVIDDGPLVSYVDKWKVFSEDKREEALEWARSIGYNSPMPISEKIGMRNFYAHGAVNVGIIHLEVQ